MGLQNLLTIKQSCGLIVQWNLRFLKREGLLLTDINLGSTEDYDAAPDQADIRVEKLELGFRIS